MMQPAVVNSILLALPFGSALALILFHFAVTLKTLLLCKSLPRLTIGILAVITSTIVNIVGFLFIQCIIFSVVFLKGPLEAQVYSTVWEVICVAFFSEYIGHVLVLSALLLRSWWICKKQAGKKSCCESTHVHAETAPVKSSIDVDRACSVPHSSTISMDCEFNTRSSGPTENDVFDRSHRSSEVNSALKAHVTQNLLAPARCFFHDLVRETAWFSCYFVFFVVSSILAIHVSWWTIDSNVFVTSALLHTHHSEYNPYLYHYLTVTALVTIAIVTGLMSVGFFFSWKGFAGYNFHSGIVFVLAIAGYVATYPWCAAPCILVISMVTASTFASLLLPWQYLRHQVVLVLEHS